MNQPCKGTESCDLCLCVFFLEEEWPLALCQNRFGGCFSSWSRSGIWQCRVAHCWITHPSDDALVEAHSGEEGPLREDEEASKWEWSIHLQREKPVSNALRALALLFLEGYLQLSQWTEEDRKYYILTQSLQPNKWAKYYPKANKRISCHCLQCAPLS